MPAADPARSMPRPMPRRHKLMLLAAFELLVIGFCQASEHPNRRGVAVELPANPRHVVT
ncbi:MULTISPECIES: hypothetical protein [Methylobacterium]|nr:MULTISPECIES: hypothetical protein [Methylobacterium]